MIYDFRKRCFSTDLFETCLRALEMHDKIEEMRVKINRLHAGKK